jgi:hypothetical protein
MITTTATPRVREQLFMAKYYRNQRLDPKDAKNNRTLQISTRMLPRKTEILLKEALTTIKQTNSYSNAFCGFDSFTKRSIRGIMLDCLKLLNSYLNWRPRRKPPTCRKSLTNFITYSNITFFFRFVNKRASYPFDIISLAHASVNVTDFSIGSINCTRHFPQTPEARDQIY